MPKQLPKLLSKTNSDQALKKTWKQASIVIAVFILFIGTGWPQKHSIDGLNQKIRVLEQKTTQISSLTEKLSLEKDILVLE